MKFRKIFILSLFLSLLFNFLIYFFFENKEAIGQGAYCQPFPYLIFGEDWPIAGSLVMTSSTPNVLIKYSGSLITGSGSSGRIAFWTGSNTLSSDNNLFWDNTNKRLGLGTTAPSERLHVIGNAIISGTLTATNISGTYAGTINAANVSSGQFGASTGGGDYYFMGNVGIGTTTPAARLQVVGGAIMPAVGNAATAGLYWPTNPGGGSGDEAFIRYYVESGENTKLLIGINNDSNDDISFYQAGAERMTIVGGNVGIGTTTPDYKLTVAGPIYTTQLGGFRIGISGASPEYGIRLDTTNTGGWARELSWSHTGSKVASIGALGSASSTTYLYFNANQQGAATGYVSPHMVITSAGNVGIGTTAPANARLHLAGTDTSGFAATIRLQNQNSGGADAFITASDSYWTAGANKLLFGIGGAPASANVKMTIQADGNVGIGTTNPGAKLHVVGGDIRLNNIWMREYDSGTAIGFGYGSSGAQVYAGRLSVGYNYGMAAPSGGLIVAGNVGIGTTNPNYKLVVNSNASNDVIVALSGSGSNYGAIALGRTAQEVRLGIAASAGHYSISAAAGDAVLRVENPSNKLHLQAGSGEAVITVTNNNVGIGTTDPGSYRLYVNGSMYASSFYCSSDIRLKKDIKKLSNTLEKIMNLNPISFTWNEKSSSPGKKDIGIPGQEIEKYFPELVNKDNEGYITVDYSKLSVIAISAIKEQQKIIEEQAQKIKTLEEKINKLEEMINKK